MTAPAATTYRGARVMVLGAGGFIGRWAARLLADSGADLQLVDRRTADLGVPDSVRELIRRVRPAVVFNLAGYGVDPTERDATLAARINADLPPILAEAMSQSDAAWTGQHVVHAGSALEYGTAAGDLHEQTNGTPTTMYGRSKLEGTTRLHETAQRLGVRAVTGRLFTVYGPGEHEGRLLPTLLAAARSEGLIPLSTGEQRRDFTYVTDAAEGLLRLGSQPVPQTGPVNIATGRLTSVRRFAECAAEVLGIDPGRLAFGTLATRTEEMQHGLVNIGRLRALTGWSPGITIAEGVQRTRNHRESP